MARVKISLTFEDEFHKSGLSIEQMMRNKMEKRLLEIGYKIAENLVPPNQKGWTLPSYKSKPGGGKYLDGGNGSHLSMALERTKNEVSVSVGSQVALEIGRKSRLDNDTKMKGCSIGYWRLFEGSEYGRNTGRLGSSKGYRFAPIPGKGNSGEGSAHGLKDGKPLSYSSHLHPGVLPMHMFFASRKEFMPNFRKAVYQEAKAAVRAYYKS